MKPFKSNLKFVCASALGLLLCADLASATLYQFQEGVWNGTSSNAAAYNVEDNFTGAFDDTVTQNTTFLGVQRKVSGAIVSNLRFDLSAAASEQGNVQQASLRLVVSGVTGSGSGTNRFYALPGGNTNWLETTASYSEQVEGTDTPWKFTNGTTISNNYDAAADGVLIGTAAFASTPTAGDVVTVDLDPAVVNLWLADPSGYAGMTILMNNTIGFSRVNYDSSEASTEANRPLLTITTIPEPSSGVLFLLATCFICGTRAIARRRIG